MLRFAFAALTVAAAVAAQSLTTTFLGGNGGNIGGAVYFDLNVLNPAGITIVALDLNVTGSGSVEVYVVGGTRVGKQTTQSFWTLMSTGAVVGATPGTQTQVAITPFPLAPGLYGVALRAIGVSHNYTNGIGNFGNADLTLTAGEATNTSFAPPLFSPRTVNCRIHYGIGVNGTVATNTSTGAGCLHIPDVSSYESFATSAAFDLANTSMTLLHTGSRYVAQPGTATYAPPSAAAQVLPLTNDAEVTVTLSQPMPLGPGAATSSLTVCSNGFISSAPGNGASSVPSSAFLSGPQTWWSICWHDYDPTIAAGGRVKFEQIGNLACVTWDGVWDAGGTSVANANTMQAQFDVTTGTVHYVYGTMSAFGNGRLVGISNAGPSVDPGSMDISAALPGGYTAAAVAVAPLVLNGASRPITGTFWLLSVGNIPVTGVIGVQLFGLTDPGIDDLSGIGMPGCGLRASPDVFNVFPVTGPTHAFGLAVPNDPLLLNAHVFATSAVFQLPPVNAFGAITSNGIDGKIGDM